MIFKRDTGYRAWNFFQGIFQGVQVPTRSISWPYNCSQYPANPSDSRRLKTIAAITSRNFWIFNLNYSGINYTRGSGKVCDRQCAELDERILAMARGMDGTWLNSLLLLFFFFFSLPFFFFFLTLPSCFFVLCWVCTKQDLHDWMYFEDEEQKLSRKYAILGGFCNQKRKARTWGEGPQKQKRKEQGSWS